MEFGRFSWPLGITRSLVSQTFNDVFVLKIGINQMFLKIKFHFSSPLYVSFRNEGPNQRLSQDIIKTVFENSANTSLIEKWYACPDEILICFLSVSLQPGLKGTELPRRFDHADQIGLLWTRFHPQIFRCTA